MYLGEIVRAMELYGYKYKSLYESESLDHGAYRLAFEDLYESICMLSAELETYIDTMENDEYDEDLILERQELEDFAHDNDYEYGEIE